MGVFDAELAELQKSLGIREIKASFLLSDLLSLMNGQDGGVFGFIDRMKQAGLREWLSSCFRGDAKPVDTNNLVRLLGKRTIKKWALFSGLSFSATCLALSFLLPRIFHSMLKIENGMVPSLLPAELMCYIESSGSKES